ncbi:MAG: hypothetical protein IJ403_10750 [Oscillospiraceae bacterium]|nr:hypothetical protein [Oscillospiraceae bacterium]
MNRIVEILESTWDGIQDFYDTMATALSMVNISTEFIGLFIAYLPTVLASSVVIFLAVYLIRFLLLK